LCQRRERDLRWNTHSPLALENFASFNVAAVAAGIEELTQGMEGLAPLRIDTHILGEQIMGVEREQRGVFSFTPALACVRYLLSADVELSRQRSR